MTDAVRSSVRQPRCGVSLAGCCFRSTRKRTLIGHDLAHTDGIDTVASQVVFESQPTGATTSALFTRPTWPISKSE